MKQRQLLQGHGQSETRRAKGGWAALRGRRRSRDLLRHLLPTHRAPSVRLLARCRRRGPPRRGSLAHPDRRVRAYTGRRKGALRAAPVRGRQAISHRTPARVRRGGVACSRHRVERRSQPRSQSRRDASQDQQGDRRGHPSPRCAGARRHGLAWEALGCARVSRTPSAKSCRDRRCEPEGLAGRR